MVKSVEKVRYDIPFLETGVIYLDNAATTPTPDPVLDSMLEYYHEYCANTGRGVYRSTKRATEAFESSRDKIAKTIGSKSKEIVYTKNATEALNLAARGIGLEKGDKVITTVFEHHSNLVPWQILEREVGIELEIVHEHSGCVIEPSSIEDSIDDKTRLVTMSHISNSIGAKQPVEEVGKITDEKEVLFLVDGAQSVGHMPVNVKELGCDFLAASGHKGLFGPQGTGFLYISEGYLDKISPTFYGGGIVESVSEHESELIEPPQVFDAGTPNIPGIIGLGRAAEYVLEIGLKKIEKREKKLISKLLEIDEIEGVDVYGPSSAEKLSGIISFNLDGLDSHEVSSMLDEVGNIATRSGHHCAMPAMNYLGIEGNVRASLHYYNIEENLDRFIKVLGDLASEFCD